MSVPTALKMVLFAQNQPLSDAIKFHGDIVLELLESRLDEQFSSLPEEQARLARKQVAIVKEFGSVQALVKEVQKYEHSP